MIIFITLLVGYVNQKMEREEQQMEQILQEKSGEFFIVKTLGRDQVIGHSDYKGEALMPDTYYFYHKNNLIQALILTREEMKNLNRDNGVLLKRNGIFLKFFFNVHFSKKEVKKRLENVLQMMERFEIGKNKEEEENVNPLLKTLALVVGSEVKKILLPEEPQQEDANWKHNNTRK